MRHHRILNTIHDGDVRVVLAAVTANHETVFELRVEKLVWGEDDVVSSAVVLFAADFGELAELTASLGLAALDAAGWALAKAREGEEEGAACTATLTKT